MDRELILKSYVRLLNKNDLLRRNNINIELTSYEQDILKNMQKDPELSKLIKTLEKTKPLDRQIIIEKYLKEKEEEKKLEGLSVEEAEIAKTFKIDIDKIQHKLLKNGVEIFQFFDMHLAREVILENKQDGTLVEQLKEMQAQNEKYQTDNGLDNVDNMLTDQQKMDNIELKMYTLDEINANPILLSDLNEEKFNKLNYLIKNYDQFNIKGINIENLIYIDKDSVVKEVVFDKDFNIVTEEPSSLNYHQNEIDSKEKINPNYTISEQNLELKDKYEDEPDIEEKEIDKIESFDELDELTKETTIKYYEYPELLNNSDMPIEEKEKWNHYVELYKNKLSEEQQLNNENPPKKLIKSDKKAGYIDALLLFLMTGFVGGILATLIVLIVSTQV